MPESRFDDLRKRLGEIAEAVNAFKSDQVQQEAFHLLLKALGEGRPEDEAIAKDAQHRDTRIGEQQNDPAERTGDGRPSPTQIANGIKGRSDFQKVSREILHKNDLWRKIQVILSSTDIPMTSGVVAGVLKELNIKTAQPSVSGCLGKHDSDLMRTAPRRKGGTRPTYKLSQPAKARFEEWMSANTK